jgi:hypothetical protein
MSSGRRPIRLNLIAGHAGRHDHEEVTLRYMLLQYVPGRPTFGTPEGAEFYSALMNWREECRARGALVASDPLHEPETATTVRVREDRVLRTDGPFAETTEWLGGYFILDCPGLDEALALAETCPTAKCGSVEVRPIREVPAPD